MFGKSAKKNKKATCALPKGLSGVIFRVFDEKGRISHDFQCGGGKEDAPLPFNVLRDVARVSDCPVLVETFGSRSPVSLDFSYGEGLRSFVHVLPYERKKNQWRFACLQVTLPAFGSTERASAFSEGRFFLLLGNAENEIVSTSSLVPEAFGYASESLCGKNLSDLFNSVDLRMIAAGPADTNESIQGRVLCCRDGSKREVDLMKYFGPDHCVLYCVFDIGRARLNEEVTQVTARARQRVGQDLHDSVGQVLTGISLLSRSLSNGLSRENHSFAVDAERVSELADDASEQIRQISRGLMPTEVVRRGLNASLRDLARMTTESCGLVCEAVLDEAVELEDGAVETHLFRIAQEAVNNAVRHSGGDRVELVLSVKNGAPQLEIRDNGRWRNILENDGGIGMKTMEYRASMINGRLKIKQSADGGTLVVCRLVADEFAEAEA